MTIILKGEPMSDLISRQAAIDELGKFVPYAICDESTESYTNGLTDAYNLICQLPSAQPDLSQEYAKAVFAWLLDYQIKAAELKGRYTPYEVLSWVANDWRKEHE